jgi:hypothetical protein
VGGENLDKGTSKYKILYWCKPNVFG